eukprot:4030905-Amphidinium_carterae.2
MQQTKQERLEEPRERTRGFFNQKIQLEATWTLSNCMMKKKQMTTMKTKSMKNTRTRAMQNSTLRRILKEKYDLVNADDYVVEPVDASGVNKGKGKGKDQGIDLQVKVEATIKDHSSESAFNSLQKAFSGGWEPWPIRPFRERSQSW